MANIKVSELNTATSFNDEDYTMIVQSGENKKITKENMQSNLYQIYSASGSQSNAQSGVQYTIYNITIPAGLYIAFVNFRNIGGGGTPYQCVSYIEDGNDVRYLDSLFLSTDWGSSISPVIISANAETTLYAKVQHNSQVVHQINGDIKLIKLK